MLDIALISTLDMNRNPKPEGEKSKQAAKPIR